MKQLTIEQKLEVLKMAKDRYESWALCGDLSTGMCYAISHVLVFDKQYIHIIDYTLLTEIFPKFRPNFFNAEFRTPFNHWWPLDDFKSRLEAFDKLIEYYEDEKANEEE